MINDILLEIKAEPKTNTKLEILEKYKDNKVLKTVLSYALDQTYQSGIKQIPEIYETDDKITLQEALDVLPEFYNGNLTGNNARQMYAQLLSALNEDDREVLIKVMTKNIDCGIQGKSANKVFGKDFICIEPYMRCSLTTEKTIKNIISFQTLGYAVSEVKMDGQYLNHVVRGNNYNAQSRNGNLFDFKDHFNELMVKVRETVQSLDSRFASGVVLNGEGLVLDDEGNILDRKAGNGIIQKANEDTISDEEVQRVRFVLWDIVPYDAYRAGIWEVSRKERRELLEKVLNIINSDYLRIVKYKKVKDMREAFVFNAECMCNKDEGTILKCETGIWKAHTSPKQLKMKVKMEVDLRITGVNISNNGKRKNLLSSLTCESSDGLVQVNVGSGFTDKELAEFVERGDELIGKVLMASTNGLIDNKLNPDKYSLYLCVFEELRLDKDTCDSYERILEIEESYADVMLAKMGIK